MGVLDTLFGGGGGDIPPTSKLRNLDITPDVFKNLRGQIAGLISGATSGTSPLNLGGVPNYTGSYTAPATGQETSLLNQLFGRAGADIPQASLDQILSQFTAGATPLQQAGQEDILKTLGGSYLNPSSNPYLSATIESAIAPLRSEWENTILPNLKLGFTKAGQTITGFGSSPFDRAASLASNEYMRNIADIGTKIAGQNYQSERDRMLQALGLGQQATGQEIGAQTSNISGRLAQQGQNLAERANQTQELVTTLQSVALPRLIEQYGLDQGVTEFRNRLNVLMQLLNQQAGLSVGTTVQGIGQSQPQQGQLGDLLAGAGGLAGGIAAFSDRRLKTDIMPLGASVAGVPLYEFAYRWEPGVRRWGVMADEVPAAARFKVGPWWAVRYDMLVA